MREEVIYLDHNATTPLDPRVLEAMLPYLRGGFGNPASRHHRPGRDAADAVERARRQVADVLGADAREIVFTSGATEADTLAVKGVAASHVATKQGRHLVTVATEHRAVLDPCTSLERSGYPVTWLGVDPEGHLDLDELRDAITDETFLVSVMHANNETGVLHPIGEIGAICAERGALFHTDATQSFGKEPIDVGSMGVHLLSLSAHKLHGPKGIGALYLRRRRPRVRCEPLLEGGGHERGLRSGTLNVPGIVGLGTAASIAASERETEAARVGALRDRLERELVRRLPGTIVNGDAGRRLANTTNLSLAGVAAEDVLERIPELAASTAAACTSASLQPSYVLAAMGADEQRIRGSVRLSLGRFSTAEEIDAAANAIVSVVRTCREASSAG